MTLLQMPSPGGEPAELSPVTLMGFIDFIRVDDGGKANASIKAYRTDLVQFMEFLDQRDLQLIEAGRKDIGAFLGHLLGKGVEGRSARRKLSVIRQFYRYLLLEKKIFADPCLFVDWPAQWKRLPKFFTPDEVKVALGAAAEAPQTEALRLRDLALVEVLYGSALRVSELVTLRLADLNFDEGVAQVCGKGDKERIVPMGATEIKALQAYLDRGRPALDPAGSKLVFIGAGGHRLTRQRIWQLIRRAGEAAGVKASPHMLRHAAATHMVENGAPVRDLQMILGHADVETTEAYVHLNRKQLHDVYRRFHPRAQRRKEQP